MPEIASQERPARRWLTITTVGCAMVALALLTVALVMLDKKHFGWLVGSLFLQTITAGLMVGAIIVLIGAWKLPQRTRWQGITLIVWALIALTSPAFGLLFILPWAVLALLLPLVIAALVTVRRSLVRL